MIHLAAQYFLNHRLDNDEVEWQTRELAKAGYQAVYAHARQGLLTPFMSDAWWSALDRIMAVCRETGMQFWIWDEDYYPSGTAGERIVWSDPGLYARSLELIAKDVSGDGPFEVDFAAGHCLRVYAMKRGKNRALGTPVDITGSAGTRRQRWGPRQRLHRAYSPAVNAVGPPHWRCSMVDNQVAVVWTPPEPGEYTLVAALIVNQLGRHPDILNPRSTRAFLDFCYEPYRERYAADMGTLIGGAFTDEPSPGGMLYPWTPPFPAEFAKDHGYDLISVLPHLALDVDSTSATVRLHYRQTQHRLQKAAYTDQIARWCRENGIISTGHLTRTEWLSYVAAAWPNELRFYQSMDIPCTDPLGAASAWPGAAAYHTGLKIASSAAHLFGKQQAGSDCLAVMGDETSIRDLKFVLDYQMAMGITFFTVHGLSYSIDGPRKDEVPPSVFYQHTQWKTMRTLLDYTRQTADALCRGKHDCTIALLYPSTSLICQQTPGTNWRNLPDDDRIHRLADMLLANHKDFDFIDETTLVEKTTQDGILKTPEDYRTLILPHLSAIGAGAAAALNRLVDAGTRVVALGSTPIAIPNTFGPGEPDWASHTIEHVKTVSEAFINSLPGPAIEGDGSHDIFVNRRCTDGETLTFLFNRAESGFDGTCDGITVSVPPRGARLIRGNQPAFHPLADSSPVGSLHHDWTIEFEANHVPLAFWHAQATPAGTGPDLGAPPFNLLERERDPLPPGADPARYHCRFMATGQIPDMRLVMEDQTVQGEWRVLVNGRDVPPFRRTLLYDCRNIETEVGHLLHSGTTPTLNVITIECRGEGRGLREMPYLFGAFACEFRHGHPSLPYLVADGTPGTLSELQPWSVLGRPSFSGTATYRTMLEVETGGTYRLDLGRVEDLAAVRLADREPVTLAWPPYVCDLGTLAAGAYALRIDITNGPANRNRLSGLPAGLLGPVALHRLPAAT